MTQAFDDRRPADPVAEDPAPARLLAGADVLDRGPAWTPVLVPGIGAGPAGGAERRRPARPHGDPPRRRLGGLDGLRAVAVLAVVAFHLDFSLLPGGFLGVDVFFVISGFLITNLLATELLQTGGLRLARFYLRRARRLLPSVLALLAVVTLAGCTLWRDQLATLPGGVLASLGYVTNWWLIADHQSYFASSGRPSMVQHLWSLAIEEQYYLVWSLAVAAIGGVLLARQHRPEPARRLRLVVVLAAGLAVLSTLVMAALAVHENLPYGASTSRVYFGSDTHSTGLFLGSAAGAWLALRHAGRAAVPVLRRRLVRASDLLGAAALLVVGYQFLAVTEFTPSLYRGGFLALDACVLVAVLCASRPGSLFGRVLDIRPLRWAGQRSYSIYVWHWPVCVVTRPDLDVHGPPWLVNTLRLVVILALSALSFRYVETPLRSGRAAVRRPELAGRPGGRPAWAGPRVALAGALLCAGILAGTAVDGDTAGSVGAAEAPLTSHPAPPAPSATAPPDRDHVQQAVAPGGHAPRRTPPVAPAAAGGPPAVSAYGDSVLLGAGPQLRAGTRQLRLDAVEGRQAYAVLDDIAAAAHADTVQPYVLIHVGDNGIISPDQLAGVLRDLAAARRVVLMTDRVPRDWQDPNNATIRSVGARFPNVVVVDWHALAGAQPSWLFSDGLHLTAQGARAYARIVLAALTGRAPG